MAESASRPVRRTRRPDLYTSAFLLLTAVFGAWALGLFVLTLLAVAQPAFFYSDQKALIKALGATVVAILALAQVFTMETAMGTLPRGRMRMRLLMLTHRWSGRIALLLAAAIAYFCLTDLGAPQVPLRAAVHGFFGATAFTVVAVKLALIRFRPQLAYNVAPWLGRYVAFAFLMIWVTSALAYFTHNL
jgi:hypothetical protein